MKPRERVLSALCLEEVDRVPLFELNVSPMVLGKILGKNLVGAPLKEYIKAHAEVGLDSCVGVGTFSKEENNRVIDETTYVDEWGRLFSRRVKAGTMMDFYMGGYLATPEKYDEFPRPDPYDPWRADQYVQAVRAAGDELYVVAGTGSIYEITAEAVGFENFLRYVFTNPSFVKKTLEDAMYFTIEQTKACIDAGAEVCMIFDDYAYKHGPMMSPKHWKKLVYPCLKKTADAVHKRGALLMLHTDGDIRTLLDMIVDAGVDAVQPLEKTAGMRLDEVKEKWGDKICIMGNIDVAHTLSFGTTEEVAKEVREAVMAAAPGGGYILCSSHTINDACKPENFLTQIKTGKKFGKYPTSFTT